MQNEIQGVRCIYTCVDEKGTDQINRPDVESLPCINLLRTASLEESWKFTSYDRVWCSVFFVLCWGVI